MAKSKSAYSVPGKIGKWRSVNSLNFINSDKTIKPQFAIQRLYE